jgi:hypothetical protein
MLEEASCDVLDLVIGTAERLIAVTEDTTEALRII